MLKNTVFFAISTNLKRNSIQFYRKSITTKSPFTPSSLSFSLISRKNGVTLNPQFISSTKILLHGKSDIPEKTPPEFPSVQPDHYNPNPVPQEMPEINPTVPDIDPGNNPPEVITAPDPSRVGPEYDPGPDFPGPPLPSPPTPDIPLKPPPPLPPDVVPPPNIDLPPDVVPPPSMPPDIQPPTGPFVV